MSFIKGGPSFLPYSQQYHTFSIQAYIPNGALENLVEISSCQKRPSSIASVSYFLNLTFSIIVIIFIKVIIVSIIVNIIIIIMQWWIQKSCGGESAGKLLGNTFTDHSYHIDPNHHHHHHLHHLFIIIDLKSQIKK